MTQYSDKKLYDFLYSSNIIDRLILADVYRDSQSSGIPLGRALISRDLISDQALGKIIADLHELPFVVLSETSIPEEILNIVPEVVARNQHIVCYKRDEKGIYVAMSDPTNQQASSFVEKKAGLPVFVAYATERDISNALSLYSKDAKLTFEQIIAEHVEELKGKKPSDPPIIKVIDLIVRYAYQHKASDIHIEPERERSLLRFRVDGVLRDITTFPLDIHEQIVTRIKVLAKMRTDEHQAAQDGKIVFVLEHEDLDMRVSIVPIITGEKIAMRLLSEVTRQFSLMDLGLSQENLKRVEDAYKKPHGMILSTGPTGCGKTTTMYAILKLLNKPNVNIMTIEDPVEYNIERVNQIQVNVKTNLTFASGLRSIVRQDPDVILVGEIRDDETAGIAVNAAMTGHLVLSTLHTNDAATALPRLTDMGIEPYLVASTANVIIAQRLVRKICTKCRISIDPSEFSTLVEKLDNKTIAEAFSKEKLSNIYYGKGCPVCNQTGYVGRIGIYEVLLMNDELREAIVAKKDTSTITEISQKHGMTTMLEDGIEKVKQGITTIEEIIRVTKE